MNTRNVLGQRQYAVSAVIADIGWLTEAELRDVVEATGPESTFDENAAQIHLFWVLNADSIAAAIEQGQAVLRQAQEATGAHIPRARSFEVREIG